VYQQGVETEGNSSRVEILGQLVALIPAILGVLFVVALVVVLGIVIVLHLTGQQLDFDWSKRKLRVQPKGGTPIADDSDLHKYREALYVYGELGPALVGVIEAETAMDADVRTKSWFNQFVSQLGHALEMGEGKGERYRVTAWTVDKNDPATLKALAHYLTNRPTLPVKGSVAGWVMENDRPHYVRDRHQDTIYRPLSEHDKDYDSVYAVPLGPRGARWGALTVDATGVDGIDECDQWIIRSLAGLASAAGATWRNERSERSEPSER
jgi:hypothetical protein